VLSIGWVMFWKAVVLAVLAICGGLWQDYKARRKAAGISLRFDKRRKTYVADDRLERFEVWARRIFWTLATLFVAYAVLVAGLIIFG
jgi:hypothetical protein